MEVKITQHLFTGAQITEPFVGYQLMSYLILNSALFEDADKFKATKDFVFDELFVNAIQDRPVDLTALNGILPDPSADFPDESGLPTYGPVTTLLAQLRTDFNDTVLGSQCDGSPFQPSPATVAYIESLVTSGSNLFNGGTQSDSSRQELAKVRAKLTRHMYEDYIYNHYNLEVLVSDIVACMSTDTYGTNRIIVHILLGAFSPKDTALTVRIHDLYHLLLNSWNLTDPIEGRDGSSRELLVNRALALSHIKNMIANRREEK